MARQKFFFAGAQRMITPRRSMAVLLLWLIFFYGFPLFPLPLILNTWLKPQAGITIDDIRVRYNILRASPELIITHALVGNSDIQKIVVGINSRWWLNPSYGDNRLARLKDEDMIPSHVVALGNPNYWEESKTYAPLSNNAIFSYLILWHEDSNLPFRVNNLVISKDKNSPIGFRLDANWQIQDYQGTLAFRKKPSEDLTLFLDSDKFNLIDVLEKLNNKDSNFLGDYLDILPSKKRNYSLEEFAVSTKIRFADDFVFRNADIKIVSADHYLDALLLPLTDSNNPVGHFGIMLRWDLENLQTLLSAKIKKSTKVRNFNTKGQLAFYIGKNKEGNGDIFGITAGRGSDGKPITNSLQLVANFNDRKAQNLQLNLQFTPDKLKRDTTSVYAFQGNGHAQKDNDGMDFDFEARDIAQEHHFSFAFRESLQAICSMFNFCETLPANLIWGHEFSRIKGDYRFTLHDRVLNPYEKFLNIRKIYFQVTGRFRTKEAFDVPFINFKSKPNSLSQASASGYQYKNTTVISRADIKNESGLTATLHNLKIQNGDLVSGDIKSQVGRNEISEFHVTKMPDGSNKILIVGDRGSFAPYLGFEKDRHPTNPMVDMLDRHINFKKKPDVQISAQLKRLLLNGDYEWRNANLNFTMRDDRIELIDWHSDEMEFFYKVEPGGAATMRMNGSHVGEVLTGAGIFSGVKGGRGTFTASSPNANTPMTGSGKIVDFSLTRLGGVAKIFDLLSISGLFNDDPDGIPFDHFTTNARMFDQQIIFDKGVLSGPSMEMTFVGLLDIIGNGTRIEGTYVPKNIITRILDFIPLLNIFFPMSGDNAVIGTRYVITGLLEDLKIRFNFGTLLTPGFLRDIFGRPQAPDNFIKRTPNQSTKLQDSPKN